MIAGLYMTYGLQHVSTQAPAVRHSQTYRPHTIWGAVPW